MRAYFTHLFEYNDWANRRILRALAGLDDSEEARALFTHVVLSQQRWLERVRGASTVSRPWFGAAFDLATCETAWATSLREWLDFLDAIDDACLDRVVAYQTTEGPAFRSTVREIVVQLNNHSVHHRAQIARMIRQQGHTPPETDYIFYTRQPD